jgi:hypothetical protein
LKTFNKEHHTNIDYQMKPWGREGECDYCITSSDKTALKSFATFIKTNYQGNERVLIKEHAACRE